MYTGSRMKGRMNAKDSASPPGNSARPRALLRVLVVEDHPVLRETLSMFLEAHGYAVASAANYGQALAVAAVTPPDVAVCDRQLGGNRDGVDTARELQKRHGSEVVFVSGTSMETLRADSEDLEVLDYIKKPALPNHIEAAVRLAAESR